MQLGPTRSENQRQNWIHPLFFVKAPLHRAVMEGDMGMICVEKIRMASA